MSFRNYWFSYRNILLRSVQKKDYLAFVRKIFGTFYKFIVRSIRHNFSSRITNLDDLDKKKYFDLDLDSLFINFNCDKGSYCFMEDKKILSHNYSIFYEKYFLQFKKKEINILELGSHEGKGIASFYFYFPHSNIIGANINPFQMRFTSNRITELYTDVSSKRILFNLSNHLRDDFDIIIDDASHNLRDILIAFSILFRKIKKGGIYVIEDMDQFKTFKELNPYTNELTPKEVLYKIKNKEDFHSSFIDQEEKEYLIENIKDIKFETGFMKINNNNVSDIAFIFKK
tara:strand:- start:5603 stop:6460 length:858 start_codon:yes stop_codon:yes gene_type:complete